MKFALMKRPATGEHNLRPNFTCLVIKLRFRLRNPGNSEKCAEYLAKHGLGPPLAAAKAANEASAVNSAALPPDIDMPLEIASNNSPKTPLEQQVLGDPAHSRQPSPIAIDEPVAANEPSAENPADDSVPLSSKRRKRQGTPVFSVHSSDSDSDNT